MKTLSTILIASTLVALGFTKSDFLNTVTDAHQQADQLHSCWEPVDENNAAAGYKLSEELYTFCSWMAHASDMTKFYVNGVDPESDDYAKFDAHFDKENKEYAALTVCLQEGFSFRGPEQPSRVSLRCLCKRSGCNIPRSMDQFFDFNKHPLQ